MVLGWRRTPLEEIERGPSNTNFFGFDGRTFGKLDKVGTVVILGLWKLGIEEGPGVVHNCRGVSEFDALWRYTLWPLCF